MRKTCAFILLCIIMMTACSKTVSNDATESSLPNTGRNAGSNTTIDYTLYQNLDVDTYENFESLPASLQEDVIAKSLFLLSVLGKSDVCNQCDELSNSLYSSLKSLACLLFHCWKPMVACVIDGECRTQLLSLGNCVGKTKDEMMMCFIASFSQPNGKLLQMMSCLGGSGCLPEPVPQCPVPTNRNQIAPVTLADLEGDWYVVRGLSPVYDCWSGQRYSFHQTGETVSTYDYTYFPVDKDTPVTIKCTTTAIPFASGETGIYPGRFRVNYTAYGMPGVDDWYCLSHPDENYVLIYYCGASTMDSYVGGIVLSRALDTKIPQNVLNAFASALANAGISSPVTLADFCTPDNSGISYDDFVTSSGSDILQVILSNN